MYVCIMYVLQVSCKQNISKWINDKRRGKKKRNWQDQSVAFLLCDFSVQTKYNIISYQIFGVLH